MPSLEQLPQLRQQPSADAILACLVDLEVKPRIWNQKLDHFELSGDYETNSTSQEDVARYLSSIIKSSLAWIDDEDQKERIWALASKRVSERCGRTAMGEITRCWPFHVDGTSPFELAIREPSLTGDLLGLKTWASSYVLALHLPRLAATGLFRLFDESLGRPRPRVLELGSGTGLLGLAAAALWRVPVYLSDLPEIVPNLSENVNANRKLVELLGGTAVVGALTWGGTEDQTNQDLFGMRHQFEIVLAADSLYDDNHPALLASAIDDHLSTSPDARAIVMSPQRDKVTVGLIDALKKAMADHNRCLICVEEGELVGQDDWETDEDGGPSTVSCWWGVFSRAAERRT